MSRLALVVDGSGGEAHQALEQELRRHGYSRIVHNPAMSEVLVTIDQQPVDLLVVPIEQVAESQLAVIDRLNRRERAMGIIATGESADPSLMLRAMRAGIKDYLIRPIDPAELTAALERIARRAVGSVSNGQVHAVFGTKGGVGASTVAVNLAYALTQAHPTAQVSVADFELPGGDVRLLLNVRPAYDVGDIASKVHSLDAELLRSVMVGATDRLWVLAAPERPEADEEIDATVSSAIVKQLRSAFNYAVLDCEHRLNDRTLAALDAADRIVLVTELKIPALRSAQRMIGVFRRLGYPNEKLGVVVNRYQSWDVVSPAEAAEVLKAEIFFCLPNDYPTCSRAATDGVPVGQSAPQSRLAVAYRQLAQRLSGGTEQDSAGESGTNGARKSLRTIFTRKRS